MANAFKLKTDTAVGTSAATIYTCPSSTETTIIGLAIANIVSSQIAVDVQIENNDGDICRAPAGALQISRLLWKHQMFLK